MVSFDTVDAMVHRLDDILDLRCGCGRGNILRSVAAQIFFSDIQVPRNIQNRAVRYCGTMGEIA
jgi:hypothetical protein